MNYAPAAGTVSDSDPHGTVANSNNKYAAGKNYTYYANIILGEGYKITDDTAIYINNSLIGCVKDKASSYSSVSIIINLATVKVADESPTTEPTTQPTTEPTKTDVTCDATVLVVRTDNPAGSGRQQRAGRASAV